jgi:uncharacterized protein YabN with tetrapyrrole methylase and pyrophosphatase domain
MSNDTEIDYYEVLQISANAEPETVHRVYRLLAQRFHPDNIESGDEGHVEEELGDVLFALVNLSRHLDVDAEGALRRTIDKFTKRFAHVEKRVHEKHDGWGDPTEPGNTTIPLAVLDGYWEEAKKAERG